VPVISAEESRNTRNVTCKEYSTPQLQNTHYTFFSLAHRTNISLNKYKKFRVSIVLISKPDNEGKKEKYRTISS
jgi:hypothetical protein